MAVTRLVYFSEKHDPAQGSAFKELSNILSSSNRNNQQVGITGALVFDDRWFLQILEGERAKVWQTFKRIENDERHFGVVVVEAREAERRIFGNWWMGMATRNVNTEHAFRPHLKNGLLCPHEMSAADFLVLITEVSKVGLSRQLVNAA